MINKIMISNSIDKAIMYVCCMLFQLHTFFNWCQTSQLHINDDSTYIIALSIEFNIIILFIIINYIRNNDISILNNVIITIISTNQNMFEKTDTNHGKINEKWVKNSVFSQRNFNGCLLYTKVRYFINSKLSWIDNRYWWIFMPIFSLWNSILFPKIKSLTFFERFLADSKKIWSYIHNIQDVQGICIRELCCCLKAV